MIVPRSPVMLSRPPIDDDALCPMAKMEITAAVPMTMPIMVNDERMRLAQSVSNAGKRIRGSSRITERFEVEGQRESQRGEYQPKIQDRGAKTPSLSEIET